MFLAMLAFHSMVQGRNSSYGPQTNATTEAGEGRIDLSTAPSVGSEAL